MTPRVPLASVLVVCLFLGAACRGAQDAADLKEVQRAQAGSVDLVLLSATGALKQGKEAFVLEFRSRADQKPVDVGEVKLSASMVMAGMPPMIGSTTVTHTSTPGRYGVTVEAEMAGSWRLAVEWDGPAGKGSTNIQGQFQ